MEFAERVARVSSSETLVITNRVFEMRRRGIDVIGLSAGEPDFDTPEHIKRAAIDAINKGFTKYTQSTGIPELKEAIASRLQRDLGLHYGPDEIIVSCGAKHALANAVFATCDRGDEVIIFTPYWVTYPELTKLSGAKPVLVPTLAERGFAPDLDALKKAIGPRTKAVLFNNPVNPSGAVYTGKVLDDLAEVLSGSDALIITDEIYDAILYDNMTIRSLANYEALRHRVVLVNGVSKAYAMTGWRIGYAAAPREFIEQMAKIQGHTTSNPTSISQWAAVAALNGPQDCVKQMVAEFKKRRDLVYERLRQIEGIRCNLCQGAFYLFPEVSYFFGKKGGGYEIKNAVDLCLYLLEKYKVALVPGDAFGSPQHVRISFTASVALLEQAMDRIQAGLQNLD